MPVTWNIVPNGHNAIEHEHFDPSETTFTTVVYRRYTRDWAKPLRNEPGSRPTTTASPGR